MNKNALRDITYGLYIITSEKDGQPVGCVANTFAQVTSSPLQASIALNKENYTCTAILETGKFNVSILSEEIPMETIGKFGFQSSKNIDKFSKVKTKITENGLMYLADHVTSYISIEVNQTLDLGTHIYFVGEVVAAELAEGGTPMTYAYYHAVKGGKTPPKASSFIPETIPQSATQTAQADTAVGWRCTVCGHVEYVDELSEDYVCPICSVGKDKFIRNA